MLWFALINDMASIPNTLLSFLSIIRNGIYSDVEIKCHSSTFRVHRCIICPQSEFFEKALCGAFQEAKSNVVVMHDDPSLIKKMIDYFYRGDYDDHPATSPNNGTRPTTKAHTHIKMYNIADKYAIEPLMVLAKKKLKYRLALVWDNKEFIQIIEQVYGPDSPQNSKLRGTIAKLAVEHLATLDEITGFHEVRNEYPLFGYDFSTAMIRRVACVERS
ncbi:hypothetical protein ASPBRDRAFT_53205 [Aspergillus brasiliensis CBS 101740]|uniref:BTB domain-containing protein n=1 Tax=Aspergillus brasiliensis (strain CBS 101740 / IMI 381727 / IBT 21946) TaxID=767769 RepID=A0A1L9UUK6_ASPBC|nr:hypothetical protein ASPBRDRAFT_53205 [Aspergillus brasiliensis CBS 101740]